MKEKYLSYLYDMKSEKLNDKNPAYNNMFKSFVDSLILLTEGDNHLGIIEILDFWNNKEQNYIKLNADKPDFRDILDLLAKTEAFRRNFKFEKLLLRN